MKELKIKCCWYMPCKYTNWETFSEGKTGKGWPIVIQQKICVKCNKLKLRRVDCFD